MLLDMILNDIEQAGGEVVPFDMRLHKSATIEIDKRYGVFVDYKAMESGAELNYTLAHECGHCATGCTHKVYSPLDLIIKHEYKANKYAITKYLSFEDLNDAICSGICTVWELAEYFDFPEHFIKKAIDYYTQSKRLRFENIQDQLSMY